MTIAQTLAALNHPDIPPCLRTRRSAPSCALITQVVKRGPRAFQRDTVADSITAILKEDPPDLTTKRPDLSPTLDRIVRHCLEKNPAERFQSAAVVAFALEALSGTAVS